MITHVTSDQEQWDAFVSKNGGGFLQSWNWSVFQEALGRRTFRYRIGADGATPESEPVAQFVLVELPQPFGRRFAYVPRGPIIAMGDNPAAFRTRFDAAVAALRELAHRDAATFVRVEWPVQLGDPAFSANVTEREFVAHGFVAGKPVQPTHTSIVDLVQSEEAILAAMHQKTRYNIRVAEKHGVTVRDAHIENGVIAAADMESFWSLLSETAERDSFHTHPRSYYAKMLEMLGKYEAESLEFGGAKVNGALVRLVLAEREAKPIAAALVAEFGDTATYLHGASRAEDRKYMAPYLLHWSIIREAKAHCRKNYDFWGIAPSDDPKHPWAGITRFKVGFGGRQVSYLGAWELPGNRFWYRVYRVAKRLHP